jgi:hypothetical protein
VDVSSNPKTDRRLVRRWLFPALFWISLALLWFRHGFGSADLVIAALGLFWLGAAWLIETRATRPRRTFYWLALASSVVAALFIGSAAAGGASLLPGILGWAGVTVLGLIWCIHFERTESLH